jgi:hypothetical protein
MLSPQRFKKREKRGFTERFKRHLSRVSAFSLLLKQPQEADL